MSLRTQVIEHFQTTLAELGRATDMDHYHLAELLAIPSRFHWLKGAGLPRDWDDILPQLEDIFGLPAEEWLAHTDPDGFLAEDSIPAEWPRVLDLAGALD
jgi:hypothetical protein